MLVENGIVRIGAEIEVASFTRGNYQQVAANLIEAGYMEGTPADWRQYHRYNCDCQLGCGRIKGGGVLVPPLVSMQYDASLPDTGAEFIVSPVLPVNGMEEMREIWEIITRDAEWRMDLPNRRGAGVCSPSIHLHVSATSLDYEEHRHNLTHDHDRADTLHALSLFATELLLLADVEEFRRGLTFRQPWRNADGRNGHHGFIEVKRATPGKQMYIEWRMFEAAYNSWQYFESSAYLAAALTRALLRWHDTMPVLMRAGYRDPVHPERIREAIQNNDTAAALGLASLQRLGALRDVVETEMIDDPYGATLLNNMFEEVMNRV